MSFRVLIVDDELSIRQLIVRALKGSGLQLAEVLEAENGEEGFRILKEHDVDFALIDLHMPLMDGEKMINEMKKDPQFLRVPLIFISGETQPDWIENLKSKSLGFIQKPFTVETLGETIMNLISK